MDEIIKIITEMSGKYSPMIIFDDFIKMVAISLSNSTDIIHNKVWEKRENQYIDTVKKYTNDEFEQFVKILGILVNLFDKEIYDYLGEIYMKCDMGNSKTGQFFTPFNLSELTAKLGIDNLEELKESNKIIDFNEPTCGGRWINISILKEFKRKWNKLSKTSKNCSSRFRF